MPSDSPTSTYPAIFGAQGSSTLVAPGSRLGLTNQPSTKITSTQTLAAHRRPMKRLSPSFTKYPQIKAEKDSPAARGEAVQLVFLPTCRTAKKASCGISTCPTCFMRFLPAFCFSSSLRLRVMSPP